MANDEWRTPEWVWKPYGPFDLDAAAIAENTVAPRFITKEMNALTCDWRLVCPAPVPTKVWCNPPYSKNAGPLDRWVNKFFERRWFGFEITALLPADTSTKWFHRIWSARNEPGITINFSERRVRHIDPATGKPGGSPKFGSMIVEFLP